MGEKKTIQVAWMIANANPAPQRQPRAQNSEQQKGSRARGGRLRGLPGPAAAAITGT
jgi:hypothetical protein